MEHASQLSNTHDRYGNTHYTVHYEIGVEYVCAYLLSNTDLKSIHYFSLQHTPVHSYKTMPKLHHQFDDTDL